MTFLHAGHCPYTPSTLCIHFTNIHVCKPFRRTWDTPSFHSERMELAAIKRVGLHRVLRTLLPSYNNSVCCSFQSLYSRAKPLSLLLNLSPPPHPSYRGAKPSPCSNNFTSLFRDGYKRLSNFQGHRESRRSELGGSLKRPSVQTLSTLGSGGPSQVSHASAPVPRAVLSAARTDGLEPGQAYLCTPRSPFTLALSLTAPGSHAGATHRDSRGALPCRTRAHSARPTTAAMVSEPGTMLVSHRLTRGLRRVSSLRRHLGTLQARVQRVHGAGPGKRTPRLPLPGAARRLGARSSTSHCSCISNTHTRLLRSVELSIAPARAPPPAPPWRISVGQSCREPSAVVSPLVVTRFPEPIFRLRVSSPLAEPTMKPDFSHEMVVLALHPS